MKQKVFEKLIHNLDDLTKNYRQLLEIVRSEKEVLRESNIDKLNAINTSKDQLITQIKSLDALRGNYASELAHHVGADTTQPRLLELAVKMSGVEGDRLRTMHSTLELLIKRLVEINRQNAESAERALHNVNKSLDSFKENLAGPKNYTRNQTKQSPAKSAVENSGKLVSREA